MSLPDIKSPSITGSARVAAKQSHAETVPERPSGHDSDGGGGLTPDPARNGSDATPRRVSQQSKRFHGSVALDSIRVGRAAGRIADEVIAHLTALVGADVSVTLEILAVIPEGASESVVRIVTENSRK